MRAFAAVMADLAGKESVGLEAIARMVWREMTPFTTRRLGSVVIFVMVSAVLRALAPVALRSLIDGLSDRGGDGAGWVWGSIFLYVIALSGARVGDELRDLVFARARIRIFRVLSERLFSHLMHVPLPFHLERQSGALTQALDSGLEGLRIVLHYLVFSYLPVTIELICIFVVLARAVTSQFLVMFCGAGVCYLVVFWRSAGIMTEVSRDAAAARVEAGAAVTDGLLNYEVVKYFNAEGVVQGRVSNLLVRSESKWASFYRRYAVNGMVVVGIFTALLIGIVMSASDEVRNGQMTIGGFVLINSYVLQMARPIEMMGYAVQGMSQGIGMLEKLVQLFRAPTETDQRVGHSGTTGLGALEFRNVCLSYGHDQCVLKDVSFRVSAGHTLGIVGSSGSGKSSIVRLLMRLLEPGSGTILFDDKAISGIALEELRDAIAVVPQDTLLFHDTVGNNIGLGRRGAGAQEIERAAKVAQLHDLIMRLPDGYDTVVGERGVKLSGGERQRVSIARAVLKCPRVYIFDEATSSLDSHTEREILRSLRAISQSKTALVIAHRLASVVDADDIIVLEGGQIVEHGTHCALLRRNGTYAALWAAQHGDVAVA